MPAGGLNSCGLRLKKLKGSDGVRCPNRYKGESEKILSPRLGYISEEKAGSDSDRRILGPVFVRTAALIKAGKECEGERDHFSKVMPKINGQDMDPPLTKPMD